MSVLPDPRNTEVSSVKISAGAPGPTHAGGGIAPRRHASILFAVRYNSEMPLKPDDTVCFCFHVPLRKIEAFCRIEKPTVPSQISECLSAGTGCGWCVPMLKQIHRRMCPGSEPWWKTGVDSSTDAAGAGAGAQSPETGAPADPQRSDQNVDAAAYAAGRQTYIASGQGQPPAENKPL